MDDEITGSDSGKGGEGGVPAQRVEMETRMLVDHAGELTLCRAGSGIVADSNFLGCFAQDKLVSGSRVRLRHRLIGALT